MLLFVAIAVTPVALPLILAGIGKVQDIIEDYRFPDARQF